MEEREVDRGSARRDRAQAVAALVAVGVLWSTAGALIKFVEWPALAIWGLRSAIASVALLAVFHRRIGWRGLTATEWASAFALTATTGLFVLANKWTTAANAILIQYAAPAWAALLAAVILGERAIRLDWVTIGLALVGVVLFFLDQVSFDHTAGNLIALAASVTFATNVVLLRKIARATPLAGATRDTPSALRAMILGHILAAVIAVPFVVTAPALSAPGWGAMVALGLLQQTAPTLLYAWAIRRVTAVEGLLIPIVEPVLSPIWVWLAHGERPGRWALLGGVIVVGAVTLRALWPFARARAARSGQ